MSAFVAWGLKAVSFPLAARLVVRPSDMTMIKAHRPTFGLLKALDGDLDGAGGSVRSPASLLLSPYRPKAEPLAPVA